MTGTEHAVAHTQLLQLAKGCHAARQISAQADRVNFALLPQCCMLRAALGPPLLPPMDRACCSSGVCQNKAHQIARMVLRRPGGAFAVSQGFIAPLTSQQHARPACPCCRARPDHASTSESDSYAYNSGSSAGQRKITIEHVYWEKSSGRTGPPGPWQMGWQMSERNLVWNDDLKVRLLKV